MLPSFLTRPVRRLGADGRLQVTALRAPALGPPLVILARGLCRFERFSAPEGLSRRAALAAARLHASARRPYSASAFALARQGREFGVWWWDAARVGAALAELDAPVRVRPEAAAQAVGAGPRVLRAEAGYEAQAWDGGFLVGSLWLRNGFDAASWSAFARGAGPPAGGAQLPTPQRAILTAGSAYGARFVDERRMPSWAPAASWGAVALSLALSAFFTGQGVAAMRRDRTLQVELTAREASAGLEGGRRADLMRRGRDLSVLARRIDRPGPLARLAEAQRTLARFDLKVLRFDAGPDDLTLVVPGDAVAGVDLVVEELEASGFFTEVTPSLDRATRRLTLKMRVRS